ncbi:MAG: hypothetical protein EOM20_20120 [Spartobacteria bacterium]|nr:hypothetical protein [Spartobacteria bacterium]
MEKREVKFGVWIESGFNLFQANALMLILASLVAVALSSITFGILSGPMMAGMILIIRALQANRVPKPEVGELFKGFDFFVPSFLLYLLIGVASIVGAGILAHVFCLGPILVLLLVFVLNAMAMFAIFFIVDKRMDCIASLKAGFEIIRSNLWPFLGFGILVMAIAGAGSILCGIGSVITLPIALCILAVAYEDITGGGAIEVEAEELPVDDASADSSDKPGE